MPTTTTTNFVYDKSRRLTTQHSTTEAHYYSYNQRSQVTQIQDVKSVSPDANRYFTYNGLGECVYGVDGTASPGYWAYDGRKILSERSSAVTARYQHNDTPFDGFGSIVEHISGDDLIRCYPAFREDGSMMRLAGAGVSNKFETSRFGVVLGSALGIPSTTVPSQRFQNFTHEMATLTTVSQQANLSLLGVVYLPAQALLVASGVLAFGLPDLSEAFRQVWREGGPTGPAVQPPIPVQPSWGGYNPLKGLPKGKWKAPPPPKWRCTLVLSCRRMDANLFKVLRFLKIFDARHCYVVYREFETTPPDAERQTMEVAYSGGPTINGAWPWSDFGALDVVSSDNWAPGRNPNVSTINDGDMADAQVNKTGQACLNCDPKTKGKLDSAVTALKAAAHKYGLISGPNSNSAAGGSHRA